MISKYLDKDNLHHAYLIEGMGDKIFSEVLNCAEDLGVKTSGNPDFCHISVDFLKIKQALDLRGMATQKSFTSGKKIFVISANRFSLDAQGVLLKMFEEPIEDTHFFIITPDKNVLAKTLISRFYLISAKQDLAKEELQTAEKFIAMPLRGRIDFIKEFVAVSERDEDDDDIVEESSVRAKAFEFINALEYILSKEVKGGRTFFVLDSLEQIFKVREYLRQPGSSTKTLLESVAINIPIL